MQLDVWCGERLAVLVDDGETCDEGDANSNESGASCRKDCTPARCGDGIQDPNESCDNGTANGKWFERRF